MSSTGNRGNETNGALVGGQTAVKRHMHGQHELVFSGNSWHVTRSYIDPTAHSYIAVMACTWVT